ncbi:MAG: PAS domain S-box protein [Limisphaerales bacterium]
MNTTLKKPGSAASAAEPLPLELEQQRLEDQLRQSEDHLRLVIDTIPGLVWSANPDGYIDYLNKRWIEYTGLTLEKAGGWRWQAAVNPEDLPGLLGYWKSILASGQAGEFEARLRRFDGVYRWFLFRGVPLHDESGNVVKWYGTDTDIEDRKWAQALLAGEKRVLEMIATGNPLPALLEALCRLVEELSSGCLCSLLLLDPNSNRLWHGAAPSLPASYTKAIDGSLIGPGTAPCGRAACLKEPVIVSDVATSLLSGKFRDLALAHNLHACWSTPILSSEGRVLGTFAIYSREPRSPLPQHNRITEQITHLAAVAVERKQSQDAIHAAKARFEGILEIADDAIISVDASQRIVLFNRGAEKAFGYVQAEVIGKPIDLLLPQRFASAHRRHLEEFAQSPDVARVMGQRREVFGLRKDGREFPAEASISKLDLGGELVFTVILRDISERKRAAEALRASELVARGQVVALTHTLDALAMESAPDGLVGHVLRTITDELHAHSSSVWMRDEVSGLLSFAFALEDGKLVTKSDSFMAAISPSLPVQSMWPWPEVFQTGKPSLMEDIRQGPVFPWREHLLAQGIVSILIVPMLIAGQVEGVIGIRFTQKRAFRAEEMELAQALATQAMLAMQLTHLSAQSRRSAVMAERNRMARDVHDTLAQGFTGVIVQLEAAADATSKGFAKEAGHHLDRAGELARESLREARRSVRALRPQSLEGSDLCEALDSLMKKMTAGTSLEAGFVLVGQSRPLPPEWDENLLRIGQEVLTNVLRHAQASQFDAQLAFSPDEVRLNLRDNGRGFDPESRHEGFGLLGIGERVEGMGGHLIIQSAPGTGTEISIVLPLKDHLENQAP